MYGKNYFPSYIILDRNLVETPTSFSRIKGNFNYVIRFSCIFS